MSKSIWNGTKRPMRRRAAGVAGVLTASLSAVMIPAATSSAEPVLCTAEVLDLTTQERPSDSPGQSRMELILTNTSRASCVVQGFPGVDLIGPEDPTFGPVYELPQQDVDFAPVTVTEGESVRSALTYLPGEPDGWVPTTISVTPPDTTDQLEIQWPTDVSVQRQDGATHPGTYVGPLQPTS